MMIRDVGLTGFGVQDLHRVSGFRIFGFKAFWKPDFLGASLKIDCLNWALTQTFQNSLSKERAVPKGSWVLLWGILPQIIVDIPNIETLHSTM